MALHPNPDEAFIYDLCNYITDGPALACHGLPTGDFLPEGWIGPSTFSFTLAKEGSLTYWWLTTGRHLPLYQRRGPRIEEVSYTRYARATFQEPTEAYPE